MPKLAANEQATLARTGREACARLDADPGVHRVAVDGVDLYAVSEFLSAPECAHLIALVDASARPSSTYDGGDYRTSNSADVDGSDPVVRMVERRICDLMGLEECWGEALQGQRYGPGQEFRGHFDWFQTDSFYWSEEQRRGGQRSWTVMVYLNDVEAGGETEFPEIRASIPPQRGALIAWNNMTPEGRPNRATLHAAQPVISGTKYVVTKWFRTRRWG